MEKRKTYLIRGGGLFVRRWSMEMASSSTSGLRPSLRETSFLYRGGSSNSSRGSRGDLGSRSPFLRSRERSPRSVRGLSRGGGGGIVDGGGAISSKVSSGLFLFERLSTSLESSISSLRRLRSLSLSLSSLSRTPSRSRLRSR